MTTYTVIRDVPYEPSYEAFDGTYEEVKAWIKKQRKGDLHWFTIYSNDAPDVFELFKEA